MGFFDGILSTVVGGVLGGLGQESANQSNQDIAAANNATSLDIAKHGVQYKMQDFAAAGLNPALAYNSGPINMPNLSTPVMQNSGAAAVEGANKGSSAALQNASVDTVKSQAQLNSASAANQLSQAGAAEAQRMKSIADADLASAQANQTRSLTPGAPALQSAQTAAATGAASVAPSQIQSNSAYASFAGDQAAFYRQNANYLVNLANQAISQTNLNQASIDQIRANIHNLILTGRLITSQTGNTDADKVLKDVYASASRMGILNSLTGSTLTDVQTNIASQSLPGAANAAAFERSAIGSAVNSAGQIIHHLTPQLLGR